MRSWLCAVEGVTVVELVSAVYKTVLEFLNNPWVLGTE
jgi:hypothetical protein